MVAGLWAVLYSKRSQNPWLKSLGLSVIAMGLLSFIYHLSNNFLTQVIDYLGMYFFVALVVLLGFLKIEKISTKTVVSAYLLGLIAFTVATVGFHFLGLPKQLIVLAGGLPIYLEYASYKKGSGLVRWLVFSLVFFVLALTSQILDVNRVFCDPQNHYFQMHMFWHLFNAVAIGFYLFYCFSHCFRQVVDSRKEKTAINFSHLISSRFKTGWNQIWMRKVINSSLIRGMKTGAKITGWIVTIGITQIYHVWSTAKALLTVSWTYE